MKKVGPARRARPLAPCVQPPVARVVNWRAVVTLPRPSGCGGFWGPRSKSAFSAPVAQLDRALASEAEGRGFESYRAYHLSRSI